MPSFDRGPPGGFTIPPVRDNQDGEDLLDQIAGVFFVSRQRAEEILHEHLVTGQRSREDSRRGADAKGASVSG